MQRLAILENFARERSGPDGTDSPGAAPAPINAAQILLEESVAPARAQRIALTCASETLTYANWRRGSPVSPPVCALPV
jgi:hypothetical protein